MDRFSVKIADRSPSEAQRVYAQAQRYYFRALGAKFYNSPYEHIGDCCSYFFTNIDKAWAILAKYVDIELMSAADKYVYDIMSGDELNVLFNQLKDAFADYEKEFGHNNALGEMPYADVASLNLRKFCYYLIASDGMITEEEADMINVILGDNYTFDETKEMLINANIISKEDRDFFEKSVMKSFVIAIFADKANAAKGIDSYIVNRIFILYEHVGRRIIASDGEVLQEEKDDLNKILDCIENVIKPFIKYN